MGAYICSSCAIGYPLKTQYQTCPICNKRTVHDQESNPAEDWEDQVNFMLGDFGTDRKLIWYRIERLQQIGVPPDTAMLWAETRLREGGFAVDLHETEHAIEALTAKGATLEQAVRILQPLC